MDPEEGEIYEYTNASSFFPKSAEPQEYDPALEWPGGSSQAASPALESGQTSILPGKLRPNQPSFRLLVLRSSILPSKHKIALLDGYSELQFGRDIAPTGSVTPKIRLKEMEVSKLHATAYWDSARREWAIVDMGSMHGTFLATASSSTDDLGTRLSPSRTASIPRKLRHMDRVTIGGTAFLVHMHDDKLPCEECSPTQGEELPLFPVSKGSKSIPAKRLRDAIISLDGEAVPSYTPKPLNDPKKALTMLKQSLLTRHDTRSPIARPVSSVDLSAQYVDRSARRRALRPASHPDAPGVSIPPFFTDSLPTMLPKSPSVEPVTSQPPTPLPSSNIGHRLLMKQGWEPGTALGASELDPDDGRIGLVEPLEVSSSMYRAGLGLQRSGSQSLPSLPDSNWKESAKRQRWNRSGYDTAADRGE
ncbi:hypothetical protein BDZ94DRAFT_1247292 [Collybia nuda]|uniref:Angiogenic factor with G patch and FHA domains 1 n=1 Tax=Collybia nuda TaxID=64659 RepID=A0A9P6CJ73_9AGAR|nr:hypothetical protein BDZ94DRAFT_1247292 [Collybia nuda]